VLAAAILLSICIVIVTAYFLAREAKSTKADKNYGKIISAALLAIIIIVIYVGYMFFTYFK
jgi:membrane protein DedA with SNARE-associated domain